MGGIDQKAAQNSCFVGKLKKSNGDGKSWEVNTLVPNFFETCLWLAHFLVHLGAIIWSIYHGYNNSTIYIIMYIYNMVIYDQYIVIYDQYMWIIPLLFSFSWQVAFSLPSFQRNTSSVETANRLDVSPVQWHNLKNPRVALRWHHEGQQ